MSRGTLLGKAVGSLSQVDETNNLNTVASYECNLVKGDLTYERRQGRVSPVKKSGIIMDAHEQCEDLAIDVLIDLSIEAMAIFNLTKLKKLASHSTSKPGTHNASLGEASSSKAYEPTDDTSSDCKASTSKVYEPNDSNVDDCKAECKRKQSSSRKETVKNTVTKSPKQEKRSRWYPQKSSRAYRLVTEFGHKLINFDIRVWWPMEQEFFRGTIVQFDPQSKRHRVHYLDNDVETLDLTKECWHFADLENLNPILELETYEGPPRPRSRPRPRPRPKSGGGSRKKRRRC